MGRTPRDYVNGWDGLPSLYDTAMENHPIRSLLGSVIILSGESPTKGSINRSFQTCTRVLLMLLGAIFLTLEMLLTLSLVDKVPVTPENYGTLKARIFQFWSLFCLPRILFVFWLRVNLRVFCSCYVKEIVRNRKCAEAFVKAKGAKGAPFWMLRGNGPTSRAVRIKCNWGPYFPELVQTLGCA